MALEMTWQQVGSTIGTLSQSPVRIWTGAWPLNLPLVDGDTLCVSRRHPEQAVVGAAEPATRPSLKLFEPVLQTVPSQ